MKIGIMLRAIDERQGIGVYTKNLLDNLLRIDSRNQYVLFYRNPKLPGRYSHLGHVQEKVIRASSKALWDQVKIPFHAQRENVDVIFHTKFTLPLFTRRKTVMTVHGAGWFVHPELFRKRDYFYSRSVIPLYCKKATAILSNSDLTTKDFIRILNVDPKKIHTVHLAADDRFRPVDDPGPLEGIRRKYNLPDRFILSVIKYDPRKNFKNLIAAFKLCHDRTRCKLVVVGIGCEKYRHEYQLVAMGLQDDVLFLGWVEQQELVGLYNLAEVLFFPSIYETFGIPVCEAMACGCPLVVAKTGSLPEIAGDAGILVNPLNPEQMAEALHSMWSDEDLRSDKAQQALLRSKEFSWEKSAKATLAVLESLV